MPDLARETSALATEVTSRLTTRRSFAAEEGMSERSLDRLIAEGIVPAYRFGTAVLVDAEGGRAGLANRKK
jgi:hypothetical protein